MLVLLHKVVKGCSSSAAFPLLEPKSELGDGNTYRAGCQAALCCPVLCHLLGGQVLPCHAGEVCGAVSSCRQITRSLCWMGVWQLCCGIACAWSCWAGPLGLPFLPTVVLLCVQETLSFSFFLVINVRLWFAHPRAGGGDVQVSFGEGEEQQLCLQ